MFDDCGRSFRKATVNEPLFGVYGNGTRRGYALRMGVARLVCSAALGICFVLPILPRELIFLHTNLFRFPRPEVLAWLVNIGHRLADDLCQALTGVRTNGAPQPSANGQLPLESAQEDEVARPILEQAGSLEAVVELEQTETAVVRYISRA